MLRQHFSTFGILWTVICSLWSWAAILSGLIVRHWVSLSPWPNADRWTLSILFSSSPTPSHALCLTLIARSHASLTIEAQQVTEAVSHAWLTKTNHLLSLGHLLCVCILPTTYVATWRKVLLMDGFMEVLGLEEQDNACLHTTLALRL